jgi:hypothetical protein
MKDIWHIEAHLGSTIFYLCDKSGKFSRNIREALRFKSEREAARFLTYPWFKNHFSKYYEFKVVNGSLNGIKLQGVNNILKKPRFVKRKFFIKT